MAADLRRRRRRRAGGALAAVAAVLVVVNLLPSDSERPGGRAGLGGRARGGSAQPRDGTILHMT